MSNILTWCNLLYYHGWVVVLYACTLQYYTTTRITALQYRYTQHITVQYAVSVYMQNMNLRILIKWGTSVSISVSSSGSLFLLLFPHTIPTVDSYCMFYCIIQYCLHSNKLIIKLRIMKSDKIIHGYTSGLLHGRNII